MLHQYVIVSEQISSIGKYKDEEYSDIQNSGDVGEANHYEGNGLI